VAERPEVELARKMKRGDRAAFTEFASIFGRKVFEYSFLMCGQRDDAEEVAQDTLLKVFENLEQIREPEHIRAWVFKIAKNACSMKRRKTPPSSEVALEEGFPFQIPDWAAVPEQQAISAEHTGILRAAIRAIPASYRTVLLLRDFEELSTLETAGILGISEDLVKTRLHRARSAVKRKWSEMLAA
jgi:RNA polymerase sigma-70 factor (ECF subfamily)